MEYKDIEKGIKSKDIRLAVSYEKYYGYGAIAVKVTTYNGQFLTYGSGDDIFSALVDANKNYKENHCRGIQYANPVSRNPEDNKTGITELLLDGYKFEIRKSLDRPGFSQPIEIELEIFKNSYNLGKFSSTNINTLLARVEFDVEDILDNGTTIANLK